MTIVYTGGTKIFKNILLQLLRWYILWLASKVISIVKSCESNVALITIWHFKQVVKIIVFLTLLNLTNEL